MKKATEGFVMVRSETLDVIISVFKACKEVLLAGSGGVVAYLYDYTKLSKANENYKWSNKALIINSLLGAFVGYTIGSLIPLDVTYRDAIIAFSGVSAFTIVGMIESRFAVWMIERVTGRKYDEKM